MGFDARTNFGMTTVATAPSPAMSGTTLTVATGTGALFPAVPFNVVIRPVNQLASTTNAEIVRVTSKGTGDNWTIARAQESTSARTILSGDWIDLTPTKKTFDDIENALTGLPMSGRLTLTSGTPIMISDVTAATNVYFTPYNGDTGLIYNGTVYIPYTFSQMTLALNNPNHAASTLYDVFYFDDSGTQRIGTGPAWSNSTPGSATRGTGVGTTELEFIKGHYLNKAQITARNGASTYTVAANRATYLGTICTSGAAGQTEMVFGGSDTAVSILVENYYNKVEMPFSCWESANSWSYNSTTWRAMNAKTTNRVTFVNGTNERAPYVAFTCAAIETTGSYYAKFALALNATNTSTSLVMVAFGTKAMMLTTYYVSKPGIGMHYLQAVEASSNASSSASYNSYNGAYMRIEGHILA